MKVKLVLKKGKFLDKLFSIMTSSVLIDIIVFAAFIIAVVVLGLYKSRGENGSEGYFLAGRGLTWWLIGISLIAANISTEQFVGMSGSASGLSGLAIASYGWPQLRSYSSQSYSCQNS